MKSVCLCRALRASLRGGLALLFASLLPAALGQSSSGTITGQVSNAATRAYLSGAVIEVAGTNRSAVADREGRFFLAGVPAGENTLVVSFTGLDTQRIPVSVQAGRTAVVSVELTSEIYALEEFTVAGMREGTALAVTLQRQAPNVKNVVASDTFGNVADGNVGDFLQRLPGITADYVGGPLDVRQVSVRGVDPDLNSVTMDGQRIASAQSANLGRAFEFEQASIGNIETIEVTKAPTPDMDADSIGGSINLVTKSAFDRAPGRRITYTAGVVRRLQSYQIEDGSRWNEPLPNFGPNFSFSYSDVLGANRRLGFVFTSTYTATPAGNLSSLLDYERKDDPGPVYVWRARVPRPSGAPRTRVATGMKVDYKWSDKTVVSLNTMFNFFHENNDTRTHNLETSRTIATVDANGNRTGGGTINPNYTGTMTQVHAHNNSFSNIDIRIDDKSGRTYALAPSVRHDFGATKIDYMLSLSNSVTYYEESAGGPKGKRFYNSRPKGRMNLRLRNVGWIVDRSQDPQWPKLTQTEGPDLYNLNNYDRMQLSHLDRWGEDRIIGTTFNLRHELNTKIPAFVKTGFSYREQNRELQNRYRRYNYAGPDGIVGNADDQLAQFADTSGRLPGISTLKAGHRDQPWPNPFAVSRHQADHPNLWIEDRVYGAQQRLQNSREITESVAAAYAMGNARMGPVSFLGGFRAEETRTKGEGALQYISPEEKARRAAWVGPVTPDEAVRRIEAEWGGRTRGEGKYRNWFPSLHAKWEPFGGLVTRASWSTGIGRPGFGSIIPRISANDDNMTLNVNDPSLRPQFSDNYDLSAEYYFEPVGLVSAGVFRKEIKDFIFTDTSRIVPAGPNNGFDGMYEGYALTTPANGGQATIEGIELNFQQQLSFLPGFWKGIGVQANYTYMRTEGDYGEDIVRTTSTLAGFLNRTANLNLNYSGHGLDLRFQLNWRDKYLSSYSATRALLTYTKANTVVNIKTKYSFSDRFSVFADVQNLFSEPIGVTYHLYEDRVANRSLTVAPKLVAGVNGRF